MNLLTFYNINPNETKILKGDGKLAVVSSNQKILILFNPSFTGTERDEIETVIQVSEFLANLPSRELKDIAWTDDLKEEWDCQNWYSERIGRFFLLINLMTSTDAIKQPKNKLTRELCILAAYRFRSLWELIKESLPLKEAVDKFCKILEEERNQAYEHFLISDFYQSINNEVKTVWENNFNLGNLNPYGSQELNNFLSSLSPKIKENRVIKMHLSAYDNYSRELSHLHAELLGKRTKEGRIAKSFQWKNGYRFTLGKDNKPTK